MDRFELTEDEVTHWRIWRTPILLLLLCVQGYEPWKDRGVIEPVSRSGESTAD